MEPMPIIWLVNSLAVLLTLAIPILIIAGGVWLGLSLARGRQERGAGESPLTILQRRYAKGELSKEQFETMKHDLRA